MKWASIFCSLTLAAFWPSSAVAGELKLPLHVLYVGNSKSPRASEFAGFLKQRCARVTLADRAGFDASRAKEAAVVLLDWSQSETKVEEAQSPLGRIEDWSKPTVLLGSAGLLMAGRWQIIGGAG
jgi:hypothetical protein